MTPNVYVITIVYCNQLEYLKVEKRRERAEELYVRLFNKWSKSNKKFETYTECNDYFLLRIEEDEHEFNDLLISLDEVPLCD